MLILRVWRTQLAEILSDGGHNVHLLISESYNHFEHHDEQTGSRRCSVLDHPAFDDTENVANSCSSHNATSTSRFVLCIRGAKRQIKVEERIRGDVIIHQYFGQKPLATVLLLSRSVTIITLFSSCVDPDTSAVVNRLLKRSPNSIVSRRLLTEVSVDDDVALKT